MFPSKAIYPDYSFTIGVTGVRGIDNAHFNSPYEVAVNATGYLYVADANNHRVQVFDSTGIYQYTIGMSNVSGSDNNHLDLPEGVAVNATGYVFVGDTGNERVQVFDNAGTYQYTIGVTGVSGTDNTHFNGPKGVLVNGTGHLYIADSYNNRIQVFDKDISYQYTIGVSGQSGSDNSHLYFPRGLAVNSTGHLYVADYFNDRVQVFDNAGKYQYTIGVTNVHGSDNAHFIQPAGVAINSTGDVYIADTFNWRVQVFDSSSAYRYTLTNFRYPEGVTVDTYGQVYIADTDNHRVQIYSNGTPVALAIAINGGSSDTSSPNVILTISAHEAAEMCFSNNGTSYTNWEIYSTSKVWTLDGGPGPKIVYFKTRNAKGESRIATDTINYTLQPTGLSILVEGGAADTSNLLVTLTLSAIGATDMCFSNNGTTYTPWEAYNTEKIWTLDAAPGLKTVYFKASNSTIEAAAPATDTITYVASPTDLSIIINGGANDTTSTSVTLTLSATGASEMCFSNNGTTYTVWEAYGTSKTWVLDGGLGFKIVYFKTRNSTYESGPVTDNITYTLQPTDVSILINGGATETGFTSVILTLSATGATEMCFSNNGITYTPWEAYNTEKIWTLDAAPGLKTVYFKVHNGTIEALVTDTITYVAPPTGVSMSINGGAAYTNSLIVGLTLSATGATEMCFSNDNVTWSAWEPYASTKTWALEGDTGPKNAYFKVRNSIWETKPVYGTIIYTHQTESGIPGFPIFMLLVFTSFGLSYTVRRLRRASRA